ncbi:MAG: enoyl-CoA hydratase/isomerase family protein [Oleiphilaceae bacterium]|nr:enoyl-CoA hydratase/isomerase family protein [Oleiphilaceae bacterium]
MSTANKQQRITVAKQDEIAVLTMNGTGENLWTEESLTEFSDQIMALSRNNDTRCLIITGPGSDPDPVPGQEKNWFCGGADLAALADDDPITRASMPRLFAQAFGNLRRFPGVTIAAINGNAHNEGLSLALNCDFRLCVNAASFQFSVGHLGLVPFGGSSQLLPRLVGEPWAKRMMLMENTIDAHQALAIGLVEDVVEPCRLHAVVQSWAEKLCQQRPMASRAVKQLIEHARMRPLETGFAAEREWQASIMDHGDYRVPGKGVGKDGTPDRG